jgi:hypothetical protein
MQNKEPGNNATEFRSLPVDTRITYSPFAMEAIARSTIQNWLQAYKLLAVRQIAASRTDRADLVFRDGSTPLAGVTPGEVRFLLGSIYLSRSFRLVEGPAETARVLLGLYRSIGTELRVAYSREDASTGMMGGWPGLKEILLYCIVRSTRPALMLETGVAQGVSTRVILSAMARNGNGHLVSVDLRRRRPPTDLGQDTTYVKPQLETGWLVPEKDRRNWTLLAGSSESILPEYTEALDVFCHDSLHTYTHMMWEFGWALDRLRQHGILISDDISWNLAFRDFTRENYRRLEVVAHRDVGVAVKRDLPAGSEQT